jgi:putative transposase
VFFKADDYRLYRRLIGAAARRAGAAIWAYCLMPNHVHLIVAPADEDGLRATFAEAHRRYTGNINARFRWTGHLFQAGLARLPWIKNISLPRLATSRSIP